MPVLHIKTDGDAAWPELNPALNNGHELVELQTDEVHAAFLDNGTVGGQPVVLLRVDQDGKSYVMQLTAKLFRQLNAAFEGKYGHE